MKHTIEETRKRVINVIAALACSNGTYSRLLYDIRSAEEAGQDLTEFWEQFTDCKDSTDVILTIEG